MFYTGLATAARAVLGHGFIYLQITFLLFLDDLSGLRLRYDGHRIVGDEDGAGIQGLVNEGFKAGSPETHTSSGYRAAKVRRRRRGGGPGNVLPECDAGQFECLLWTLCAPSDSEYTLILCWSSTALFVCVGDGLC